MTQGHPGHILPQDTDPADIVDEVFTAQPVSRAEIDDLLYGDDRPPEERLARLRELAEEMRVRAGGDFGDNDTGGWLNEIEDAVARLSGDVERDAELEVDEVAADDDPLYHRETLAPDSDELEEIEEEDEASLSDDTEPLSDDVLDPEEWDDGDGFDVDRGVRH